MVAAEAPLSTPMVGRRGEEEKEAEILECHVIAVSEKMYRSVDAHGVMNSVDPDFREV